MKAFAIVVLLSLASLLSPTVRASTADERPASDAAEARPAPEGAPTALRLFVRVEEAWAASDAERLAALVDTTSVRIAVKPGAPLAAALTRVAAAFLFQDQLRLVKTQGFRIARFEAESRKPLCRATAIWSGDWGGRRGRRDVHVALTARLWDGRWLLTEIRAED